jgi:cyclic pyranopterin phosphate synthase
MLDSFGRELRYLRVSVTDRCNLRCVYCMPPEGVKLLRHNDIISYEQIAAVARAAAKVGFAKIRLTGGEPLARLGVAGLVTLLRAIPDVSTIAMTTNGTLLAPLAASLKAAGLDSVNVSLDTLDEARYAMLTRGGRLSDAMAGIDAALASGMPVKINVVAMEDSPETEFVGLRSYAKSVGAEIQFIARYSLRDEKMDGGEYDRPPPCGSCDRLRLLANGVLRPCLHGNVEVPVDFGDIEGSIAKAVRLKPARGHVCTDLEVGQIGG